MIRVVLLAILAAITGCAFAPYPHGMGDGNAGVLGVNVGSGGQVAPEAQQLAGDTLGTAASIFLGAGGVSTIGAIVLTAVKAIRTAIEAANLKGQNAGWDQREQAAAIQAPFTTAAAEPRA